MRIINKRNSKRITAVILAVVMAFSTVISCLAVGDLVSKETLAKSKEIAKQIEAEGIVLLENEDNVLPLQNIHTLENQLPIKNYITIHI